MSFATQLTSDEATFFNDEEFAQEITYGGVTITAVVIYGDADTIGRRDFQIEEARLEVKISDVASPSYRDVVVIDSATWYVQRIISKDEISSILGLERAERPELYGA